MTRITNSATSVNVRELRKDHAAIRLLSQQRLWSIEDQDHAVVSEKTLSERTMQKGDSALRRLIKLIGISAYLVALTLIRVSTT